MPSLYKWGHLDRRAFIASSASVFVTATAVFAEKSDKDTLRFGLTPVFLNDDIKLLSAIRTYLADATGYAIDLVTRRTYQEVTALLVSGQLDAAWICGYPFVKYRKELELVAVPQWNGKPHYQSYLIAAADRRVTDVMELRGDIHAYSDPDSNSGYLVTQALLHEKGFDPETFFNKVLFTYAHRNVIRAVASGLVQSGSVDGYVWEVLKETDPDLVSKTKVVRKSEWFGFPPVAAVKGQLGTRKIIMLQKALLSSTETEEGRMMLDYLRLSGFGKSPASLFDSVADNVAALRGVL
ncbi:MAG: PhnD/SsuA/transferrin family substrate-binding protein [Stappiaceae bacterium]